MAPDTERDPSMDRRSITRSASLSAAVLAVAGLVAACSTATGAPPSDAPGAPTPSQPATPIPTVKPSPSPDGHFVVELDIATDHDVSVVVDDETGSLVGVSSGRAGDGISVQWGKVDIVNVDEDTLRVTWAGLPVDALVELTVSGEDGAYRLDFVQPAPPPYSDAIGFDRVLVLDFDGPVSADAVQATFETAAS
jgi:hypothetical protein